MSFSRWVHIDVTRIKKETEKAFLIVLESGEEVWIPFSQISDYEDYKQGDRDCSMSITEWIAQKNGIG